MVKDKIAVVSGGASGIGKACVERLVKEGAKVAVWDFNEEGVKEVVENLKQEGYDVIGSKVDVSDKAMIESATQTVKEIFGKVDILVCAAGVSKIVPFLTCSEEIWDKTLDINLKGQFLCAQALIPLMEKGAAIVNFSSQSGKKGTNAYAAYCASKFGVIGLTQSIAAEFAPQGIRCNAICPGVVLTPMWDAQTKDYAKKKGIKEEEVMPRFESNIPLGRLCTLEEVTNMVLFLASEQSSYMTGQALNLTGGSCMY